MNARCAVVSLLTGILLPALAQAANSVLIWPVDPKITADAQATELWLENRGDSTTLMQVRLFSWLQVNGQEQYQTQQKVVASPPMVRIEPGKRQQVRLIRQGDIPAGSEQAYRVLLDEIPTPQEPGENRARLNIQMRYSVPLFVYGKGADPEKSAPQLSWRVLQQDGRATLEIVNRGNGHARLSNPSLNGRLIAQGLYGYVLPHSMQRWTLPFATGNNGELRAELGGSKTPWRSQSASR